MANAYFDPGEQRAAKVRELFARIAPRYDLINDLQSFGLHRYWKRQVVRLAHPQPGERGLDVCCGTGDLTFAFAGRELEAVGLDFSEQMLGIARNRAIKYANARPNGAGPFSNQLSCSESAGEPAALQTLRDKPPKAEIKCESLPTPQFVRADAQRIPFPDNTFDVLTIGYGLRNLADWNLGLAEMHRVLRGGGRLLVLDFGKPDNVLWRRLYFGYLSLFVPILGRIFCGSADAYRYILESLKHYPAQHGVAAAMRERGFCAVRIVSFLGGVMTINYGEKPAS